MNINASYHNQIGYKHRSLASHWLGLFIDQATMKMGALVETREGVGKLKISKNWQLVYELEEFHSTPHIIRSSVNWDKRE